MSGECWEEQGGHGEPEMLTRLTQGEKKVALPRILTPTRLHSEQTSPFLVNEAGLAPFYTFGARPE